MAAGVTGHVWKIEEILACSDEVDASGLGFQDMDIVYLLTGPVLAVIMFNGVWMLVNGRPPIVRLGRHPLHLPKTAAANRWVGAAQIVGTAGVGTEFSLLVANSASPVGGYIATSCVGAMYLCLGGAWCLDYRARRPVSN